jgi:deaminated glutathione amidase
MRIAIAQMTSGIEPAANGDAIVAAIEVAASGAAAMLFTPEMSNMVDGDGKRALPKLFVEDEDPVLTAIRAAAAKHGIWAHIGSMAFLSGLGDGRRVNRGLVIDDQGKIRARYDKMHLFDVDLATGESWRESASYVAGERAVVAQTPVGALGLSICYDLRFPALFQAQSAAGATILSIPAAFTVPTGQAHWHVLMRARAIENAAWVVCAAQVGDHADGRATYGHSLVVAPWGDVILDMGSEGGIGFADIDQTLTTDSRARVPVIAHRRTIPPVEMAA